MRLEPTTANVEEYLERSLNPHTAPLFHGLYKLPRTLFLDLLDLLINHDVLLPEVMSISLDETSMRAFISTVKNRAGIPDDPPISTHQNDYLDDGSGALRKIWRWSYDTRAYLPMPVYPYLHATIPVGSGMTYASESALLSAASNAGVCTDFLPVPSITGISEINTTVRRSLHTLVSNFVSPPRDADGDFLFDEKKFTTDNKIYARDNPDLLELIQSFFPAQDFSVDDGRGTHESRMKMLFQIGNTPSVLSTHPGFAWWLLGTHHPHTSIPDWVEIAGRQSLADYRVSGTFRAGIPSPLVDGWVSDSALAERLVNGHVARAAPPAPWTVDSIQDLRRRYSDLEYRVLDVIYAHKHALRRYIWRSYHLARTRIIGRFPERGERPVAPTDKIPNGTMASFEDGSVTSLPTESAFTLV